MSHLLLQPSPHYLRDPSEELPAIFFFEPVRKTGGGVCVAEDVKFPKLMANLQIPVWRRVRTNNHVERTNRMVRFLQKARYKWRRRRALVRFVVMTLDGIWREWTPAKA
jgi:hypothetical protein